MKVAMVFPSRESEKAISSYSIYLVEALRRVGVDVDEINYTAGSFKSFRKIVPKLKKYDVVHLQHEYNMIGSYGLPYFYAYRKLKSFKKPKIVTTMHTALSTKAKFKGSFLKTMLRKILYVVQNRTIRKKSDLVFVHSEFYVPLLVNEYKFPKEKIRVYPHGIIEGVKITSKEKAKKELGLKGPVYLLIGNLHKDHGADIIIRQADKVGKTILVVSSPHPVNDRKKGRLREYMEELQRTVKKNKFEKYVRFDIAPISDQMPKWWKYFSAADFVLQPYRGGIGSGIFTHAMATKTPVICSSTDFFKDIEKNYPCLKMVKDKKDYGKAIKESLKKREYNKLLKGVEKYYNERNWTSIAKGYKKDYFSLK